MGALTGFFPDVISQEEVFDNATSSFAIVHLSAEQRTTALREALKVIKPVGTACSRHKEKSLPALKQPKDHLRCCQRPYSIRSTSRKCPMCTRPRRL